MRHERNFETEPKIGGQMLVIGASGFVGSEVRQQLSDNFEISSPKSSELNIANSREVAEYIASSEASVICLLAAETTVKKFEKETDSLDQNSKAWQINVNGSINVAEACRQFNKRVIHISTGYVFEDGTGPYTEDSKLPDDILKLNSEYAMTKLLGEKAVFSINPENTSIIRIDYPFGDISNEKDYLRKVIWMMENGFPIMSDQDITPTYMPDLARAIDKIAQKKLSGIFHVASNKTTPYDLALLINENLNHHFDVKKGYVSDYIEKYGIPAWPIKSGLATGQTRSRLDISFTSLENAVPTTLNLR